MIIVYSISSYLRNGGLEVVTAVKAEALAAREECEVWIVNSESPDTIPLKKGSRVRMLDLGIRYNQVSQGFPLNLFVRTHKMLKHRKALKAALRRIQPDIVISAGEDKFFLPFIRGPWKTVREIHFPKNHRQKGFSGSVFTAVASRLADLVEYGVACRFFDRVVVLTPEDMRTNWRGRKNVCAIPNPVRFQPQTPSSLTRKRIIAVGRLVYEKNFSSLIRAYALVADQFPEWRLDIYGEGSEYSSLLSEITRLGLSRVVTMQGRTTDVEKEMLASSVFVVSSRYEGFSLALVEAMACGLPTVSYSCPYGPQELIHDGENGFLVPAENERALAERLCRLMADDGLRKFIGANAFDSARQYSIPSIIDQWMTLLKGLLSE